MFEVREIEGPSRAPAVQMVAPQTDRETAAVGVSRPVGGHTFLHSFVTHLFEAGYGVGRDQGLLGHTEVVCICRREMEMRDVL